MLKQYSSELNGRIVGPSGAQSRQANHFALPGTRDIVTAAWLDPIRFRRWDWLASPWERVVRFWMQWRRERKIKREVTALAELEDRLLRDIGIPARSQIEETVRGWHDG